MMHTDRLHSDQSVRLSITHAVCEVEKNPSAESAFDKAFSDRGTVLCAGLVGTKFIHGDEWYL